MDDPADTAPAPRGRREQRKAQTRGQLVRAARALFARQGVDLTRINEITDTADVGLGSFYNHFSGKTDIVREVAREIGVELGEGIATATEDLDDIAEVVAAAHRAVVALAAVDPNLGWLMVRLELSHDLLTEVLGPYAVRDLARGVASGRFVVDEPGAALLACGGALLAVVRAVLQGRVDDADVAAEQHATAVLRLLGVDALQAREIARRPLPPLRRAPEAGPGAPGSR